MGVSALDVHWLRSQSSPSPSSSLAGSRLLRPSCGVRSGRRRSSSHSLPVALPPSPSSPGISGIWIVSRGVLLARDSLGTLCGWPPAELQAAVPRSRGAKSRVVACRVDGALRWGLRGVLEGSSTPLWCVFCEWAGTHARMEARLTYGRGGWLRQKTCVRSYRRSSRERRSLHRYRYRSAYIQYMHTYA